MNRLPSCTPLPGYTNWCASLLYSFSSTVAVALYVVMHSWLLLRHCSRWTSDSEALLLTSCCRPAARRCKCSASDLETLQITSHCWPAVRYCKCSAWFRCPTQQISLLVLFLLFVSTRDSQHALLAHFRALSLSNLLNGCSGAEDDDVQGSLIYTLQIFNNCHIYYTIVTNW